MSQAEMEEEDDDIMEFEVEDEELEETDDGGAIAKIGPDTPERVYEFYDNIAEKFPSHVLETLATELLEDIDRDKKAREKRDKEYAEAIKRTGLGDEAPGGASFNGASRVVHPMLTEACVDFTSRAIREIMPPNGPVKVMVPGDNPSPARLKKAERKKAYMNWQFLVQMPEFRSELEQLLTQLALDGSQYLRLVWDQVKRRPVPTFVPSDDVYIPYAASNFYTAERVTFVEHITSLEFRKRVESGMYIDVGDRAMPTPPEQTEAGKATDRIEGRQDDGSNNEDGLRPVFEINAWSELEEEFNLAPYLITVDNASRKVVSIVRNWEEEDEAKQNMHWLIDFTLIPWRGAKGIGLGQMVGSLSGGATGALRALLDSAHVNNLPTLLKLKGTNFSGQTKDLDVAAVTEIEGGVATDDIRKLVMAVPFNEPSQTLMALLGFLVDAGKGVVRTSFDGLAEMGTNMPVGTTLALIEEGMKVLGGIHLRLYHSMTYLLRLLHRIDRLYLTDEDVKDDTGTVLAKRSDFTLPLDVVPVADPEVFSDVQRLAQLQIVADRAALLPMVYNVRKVEERLLERAKIPNYEELLIPEQVPEQQNAVNENAAMTFGRPVAAFPQQDHLAHLQVHLDFMRSPHLGLLPIVAPTFISNCLNHIKEHIVLWYVAQSYELLKQSMQLTDDAMAAVMSNRDPDTRKELDRTLAAVSQKVVPMSSQVLNSLPQIIQQAMQLMQQFQQAPQMPTDPNKMAEIAVYKEVEQGKQKLQATKDQGQQQLAAQRNVLDMQRAREKNALDITRDREKAVLQQQSDEQKRVFERDQEFMKLDAAERQKAIESASEDARQAQEYAARLRELQLEQEAEDRRTAAELSSKERINAADNITALRIAAAEIESGERVAVESGKGINPSASD